MTNGDKEEKISIWLYKYIFNSYEKDYSSTVLRFKLIEFTQIDNTLHLDYEFYVLQNKKLGASGLFRMSNERNEFEYFPFGIYCKRIKNKCIFESETDCDMLGATARMDLAYYDSELYCDWRDRRIPEELIADLFDYRCAGTIGLKIIKVFNLLDEHSRIPDCVPDRLIPHLEKSIIAYRSLLA